jgi:hypothetical protein
MPSLAGRQPDLETPHAASLTARDTGDHSDSMTQVIAALQAAYAVCLTCKKHNNIISNDLLAG